VPTLEVENTTSVAWQWTIDETTVVGTEQCYTPLPTQLGRTLAVTVTPSKNVAETWFTGAPVSIDFGTIATNPLAGIHVPAFDRAARYPKPPSSTPSTPSPSSTSSTPSPTPGIRVMSYNILADHYCQRSVKEGQFHYLKHIQHVHLDYRRQLLLQELLSTNADIVLLQECTGRLFASFLVPCLAAVGYKGRLDLKTTKQDGCAVFYKTKLFHALKATAFTTKHSASSRWSGKIDQTDLKDLQNMNSVVQCIALQCTTTRKVLCVAHSHLYYHPRGEKIRVWQTQLMLMELFDFAAEYGMHCGVLVAGDFNATPETATIELLRNGVLHGKTTQRLFVEGRTTEGLSTAKEPGEPIGPTEQEELKQEATPQKRHGNYVIQWQKKRHDLSRHPNVSPFSTTTKKFKHPFQLISSIDDCLIMSTNNQPLTTLTELFDGTLDWVFIDSNNLAFTDVWHNLDLAQQHALPNALFPSDHVAVVCEISFKLNLTQSSRAGPCGPTAATKK
jgi:2',5'-phosphodiesterase